MVRVEVNLDGFEIQNIREKKMDTIRFKKKKKEKGKYGKCG